MMMITTRLMVIAVFAVILTCSVTGFVLFPLQPQRVIKPLFGVADKDESIEEGEKMDEDSLSLNAFQQERARRGEPTEQDDNEEEEEEFDGYVMRDIIVEKWGEAFDLEFQRVEAMGFKEIYLNVMPFPLGSKRFRHATELDYLCHLQAVVEILLKYDQVGNVLYQIDATNKKPRAGTSPLIAVPLRLDLTPEQVDKILGP